MNNSFYCISIEPFVYTDVKNETALLLNTYSKNSYIINDEATVQIISKIKKSKRQCINITQQEYEKCCKGITMLVKRNLISFLQLKKPAETIPFQFKDNVYFVKDFWGFSSDAGFALYHTSDLLNELMQINIYLSSSCGADCKKCSVIAKQSLYCYSEKQQKHLSIESFKKIIHIASSTNCKINLLGGDITNHPNINEVLSLIASIPSKQFYIYLNSILIDRFCKITNTIPDNIRFVLLCNDIKEYLKIIVSIPNSLSQKIDEYKVLIFSKEELSLANKQKSNKTTFTPIYIGTNSDFFEENIYLTYNDFKRINLTISQILFNKKFNSYNYGIIYMFPDGTIKSGFSTIPLGNISEGLENILWKEMKRKDGWMKIRNEKPCCNCVYQYICPPPSNYESIIGKPNLCTIKP